MVLDIKSYPKFEAAKNLCKSRSEVSHLKILARNSRADQPSKTEEGHKAASFSSCHIS